MLARALASSLAAGPSSGQARTCAHAFRGEVYEVKIPIQVSSLPLVTLRGLGLSASSSLASISHSFEARALDVQERLVRHEPKDRKQLAIVYAQIVTACAHPPGAHLRAALRTMATSPWSGRSSPHSDHCSAHQHASQHVELCHS